MNSCSNTINVLGKSGIYNGVSFGNVPLLIVPNTPVLDAIQLCSGLKSICNNCGTRTPGTFSPGIEIYTFQGYFSVSSIPAACCEIAFVNYSCCKNIVITTLANPSALNVYTEAVLNRCDTAGNSSPVFSSPPVIYSCSGQDFSYNMGATDPDGDSLSYGLGTALESFNVPAPYAPGFSPTAPFQYFGFPFQGNGNSFFGMYIDAITGDVRFRPIGNFVAVFILEIKQWRKINNILTLVGTTRRDVDFFSSFCSPNNPPEFKTYNDSVSAPTSNYNFSFCAGERTCKIITVRDVDQDSTVISWNSPGSLIQKGATFLPAYSGLKPRQDSFIFCWTPSLTDINNNRPYYFLLTGFDNKCQVLGRVQRTFSVTVKTPVLAQITKLNSSCKTYRFGYNRIGPKTGNITWNLENLPGLNTFSTYTGDTILSHSFAQHGIHKIRLILAATPTSCETIIEDTVMVPDMGSGLLSVFPNVIIGDSIVCKGKIYSYRSDTISSIYTYQWQLPYGWMLYSGQGTSQINVITGSNSGLVGVSIMDNCNTSLIRTRSVTIFPDPITPAIIYGNETPCRGSEQSYYSNIISGVQYYLWQVPSGYTIVSGQGTNLLKVMIGLNQGPIILKTIVGCDTSGAGILLIRPFAAIQPNFIDGDSVYCPGINKMYSLTGTASGHSYLWTLPAGWSIVSGQGYGSIIANTSGAGGILKVKAIYGCDTSIAIEKVVNVIPKPVIGQNIQGPDTITGVGSTHVFNILPEPGALSYNWQIPPGWSINSGQGTPNLTLSNNNSSGTIWLKMTFDCDYKDSLSKYIIYQNSTASSGKLLYEQDFNFYPNPSNGIIFINYNGMYNGTYKMSILTAEGKEVYTKTIDFDGSNIRQINLDMLGSGAFFIKIQGANGQWQKPILLVK
ncbi:MAG: T9SS type A sorting domain-containing protein [Bacteroidota bacterium]|nr:T9SS type A sorting domain-containing protein [Bacteroidota bacterium]